MKNPVRLLASLMLREPFCPRRQRPRGSIKNGGKCGRQYAPPRLQTVYGLTDAYALSNRLKPKKTWLITVEVLHISKFSFSRKMRSSAESTPRCGALHSHAAKVLGGGGVGVETLFKKGPTPTKHISN
ncbi:hypothetical protein [Desulfovibrio sp.]|uniref:hypothetical protein n=1 Tax=Desulfovibrio sp. TaxID=885 RepID=UPI003D09C380